MATFLHTWARITIYLPTHWEGMAIDLKLYLGKDCHLSIHLFERNWRAICLFIREGMIIYQPSHLGGDGHNLPCPVGVDGQLPI